MHISASDNRCVYVGKRASAPQKRSAEYKLAGGYYGLMVITGWMVKKVFFSGFKTRIFVLIGISSCIAGVELLLYSYRHHVQYTVWYDNGLLFLTALSVFIVLLRIKKVPLKNCLMHVATSSFGIYLFHNIPMMYINKTGLLSINSHIQKELILFLCVFIISLFVVEISRKIRLISTVLFGIKHNQKNAIGAEIKL